MQLSKNLTFIKKLTVLTTLQNRTLWIVSPSANIDTICEALRAEVNPTY